MPITARSDRLLGQASVTDMQIYYAIYDLPRVINFGNEFDPISCDLLQFRGRVKIGEGILMDSGEAGGLTPGRGR